MTSSQTTSQDLLIPNFLDLPDGEIQKLSQEAVLLALKHNLDKGLPVVVWNDGKPYNKIQTVESNILRYESAISLRYTCVLGNLCSLFLSRCYGL